MLRGFSLIESLVAFGILAILIGVGYPSYQNYRSKAQRVQMEAILLAFSSDIEEFYHRRGTYEGALEGIRTEEISPFYRVLLTEATKEHYLLSAIPKDSQMGDRCGTLKINESSRKLADELDCW